MALGSWPRASHSPVADGEHRALALSGAALGILFAQWGTRLLVGFSFLRPRQGFSGPHHRWPRSCVHRRGRDPYWPPVRPRTCLARHSGQSTQSAMKANARGVIEGSRFRIRQSAGGCSSGAVSSVGGGRRTDALDICSSRKSEHRFSRGSRLLLTSVDLRNGHYPARRAGPRSIGTCWSVCAPFRVSRSAMRAIQHDSHQRVFLE